MRRTLAAAVGASALLAAPTAASAESPSKGLERGYLKIYDRVERLGGDPGRNIVEDDVLRKNGQKGGKREKREATRRELIRSIDVMRRMEASLRAPAAPAAAAPSTASAGLEAIAACESGGNPAAVSPDGTYRGKYQFDMQTWQSVGGTGDPAAASEAEQDRRAAILVAQRGHSPWPTCG